MIEIETRKPPQSRVPPATTLLVSLFLILLCFFIALTSGLSLDEYKQTVAMNSVGKTFGKPSEIPPTIAAEFQPKHNNYAKDLKQLFGDEAYIESSLDGDRVKLVLKKDYFYYPDEVVVKNTQAEKAGALFELLKTWNAESNAKVSVALSLSDYELDKQRLEYFRDQLQNIELEVGLTYLDTTQLTIITEK